MQASHISITSTVFPVSYVDHEDRPATGIGVSLRSGVSRFGML